MKTLCLFLILLYPVASSAQFKLPSFPSTGSDWVVVGTTDFSPGEVADVDLAIGPGQMPYTVFQSPGTGQGKACVMKYNGSEWEFVGDPYFSPDNINWPSIAFSPDQQPYIAFNDYAVNTRVSVMRHSGTSWQFVGNEGLPESYNGGPRLAFNPATGEPYVEFHDGNQISVMRFDGNQWVYVGPRQFSPEASSPDFGFNPVDGLPYVVYVDSPNNGKVTLDKFTGTGWVHVGNPGFTPRVAFTARLAFDHSGHPLVLISEQPDTVLSFSVFMYKDSSWSYVGNPAFPGVFALYGSLAVGTDDRPYVSFYEYGVGASCMKFNGTEWVYVGSPDFSGGVTTYNAMAIDSADRIYIGYADGRYKSINWETVMKFDTLSVGYNSAVVQDFTIQPNPFTGTVEVNTNTPGSLSVLTIMGQSLYQQQITGQHTAIDLGTLSPGIYLFQFSDQRQKRIVKVIKE